MSSDATAWKRCSTCKKDIPFGAEYFVCSVSTCNRGDTALAFCTVECWDAHVPIVRHRDSSAIEERAPTREAWAGQTAAPRRRVVSAEGPRSGGAPPREVLIVVSKLKTYVRERSGMNTSDGVAAVLSDRVRALCDRALERARNAGRRTLLDRDFE